MFILLAALLAIILSVLGFVISKWIPIIYFIALGALGIIFLIAKLVKSSEPKPLQDKGEINKKVAREMLNEYLFDEHYLDMVGKMGDEVIEMAGNVEQRTPIMKIQCTGYHEPNTTYTLLINCNNRKPSFLINETTDPELAEKVAKAMNSLADEPSVMTEMKTVEYFDEDKGRKVKETNSKVESKAELEERKEAEKEASAEDT
jgi:hypothetical protein